VTGIVHHQYKDGDLNDPDRPRSILKPNSQQRERAPYSSLKLVKFNECIQLMFAQYPSDKSPEGLFAHFINSSLTITVIALLHSTKFCCDWSCHNVDGKPNFNLQDYLPGKIFTMALPSPDMAKTKQTRNKFRPTAEWPFLEFQLLQWLEYEHSIDPLRSARPPHLVLLQTQRMTLMRTHPTKIRSEHDITTILDESKEWADEQAAKVFAVIEKFKSDYSHSTEKQAGRKRKLYLHCLLL